jgi:hypothetical protein
MLGTIACVGCLILVANPGPRVDTELFCKTYIPSIRTDKDFERLKKLPDPMRSRIRDNEVNYLCDCMHWDNDLCKSTQPSTLDKSSPSVE